MKCEHKLMDKGNYFECSKCGEKFSAWMPLNVDKIFNNIGQVF